MEVLGYFWNRNYDDTPPENHFEKCPDDIFPRIFAELNAQALRFCITCKRFSKFLDKDKGLQIYQAAMGFLKLSGSFNDKYSSAFLHFDPHLALKKVENDFETERWENFTEIAMSFKTFDKEKALEIASSVVDFLNHLPHFTLSKEEIPLIRSLLEICPDRVLNLFKKCIDADDHFQIIIALAPSHPEEAQKIFDNYTWIPKLRYTALAALNPKKAFAEIKKLDKNFQDQTIEKILEFAPLYPFNSEIYKEFEAGICFSANNCKDLLRLAEFHLPYDLPKAIACIQQALGIWDDNVSYILMGILKKLNPIPKEISDKIWELIESGNDDSLAWSVIPADPVRAMLHMILRYPPHNGKRKSAFCGLAEELFVIKYELTEDTSPSHLS